MDNDEKDASGFQPARLMIGIEPATRNIVMIFGEEDGHTLIMPCDDALEFATALANTALRAGADVGLILGPSKNFNPTDGEANFTLTGPPKDRMDA